MNTKSIDMMARAFSTAAKNGAAKKAEKSEFRDIMNSSAASAKEKPESIKQDRPENSQKPSGDKQSSKPQETGSSDQPTAEIPAKGPDSETADMAAAASLMAAMNIQAKPEIQTVSVEDGKISIAVMGNEIAKPETQASQMIQGVAAQAEKLQADSAEGMMQKMMPASEESQAGNTASQIQKTAAEASQPAEQKQQAQDIRLNQDMKHSAEADAKPEIQVTEKKSESDSEASDSNLNNDLSAMNRAQKSEQPESIKQDRPENSQKPSGDKQSSKPQETGSSDQPTAEIPAKGPDSETADMAAAASLMAAMNIQAKPEIQTVSVEDGKISIAVMGNEIAKPETQASQMIQGVAAQAEKLQADSAEGMMQKMMPASEESQAGNTASQIQKTAAEASQPAEQKQQAQDIRLNQDMKHSAEADAKPEIQVTEKKSESDSEASDSNLNNDLSAMNRAQKSEQPEIIKVKVGDMQKAGSAEFTKAVAENIEIMKNGADSYEIQLDPENLGKIKVNISFEQGQTNISLTCTNARTAGLLAENASMLAQIIQENNGTSASVNVQDESGYLSQEKGENQNQQSHQQRQNQSSDENQEFSDQIKLGLWEIENLRRQYQMSQIS